MVTSSKSWFQTSLVVVCVLSRHIAVQSAPSLSTSLAGEGSGAPIIAVQSNLCSGKGGLQTIKQKLENIYINSRSIQDAIFGSVLNSPIPSIGLYRSRIFKQSQPSGAAVAYSVQYFMCFVEPVADALKNETYRAVVQRAQGSVFNDGLVQVLTNLSVAKDLYQLVQNVPINSGRTPNVTKSSVTCPAPIIAPMPVPGVTAELTYVGAIASELSNLSDDIRVQLSTMTC